MIYIDKYAYVSGLAETKPELKLVFGVAALVSCVCSKGLLAFCFIFGLMMYITVFKARIPFIYYLKLLILPFGFLIFGVLGVAVNITVIPELSIGLSQQGISLAVLLICKSISSVSCLYFIILTTPIRDIISFMNWMRFPKAVITLATLMYRFIFLLMEIAATKIKSQQCRHGYERSKGFTKIFGMLWGSVFIQSFISGEWVYKAMTVRGYDGDIRFLSKKINFTFKDVVLILFFVCLVIFFNFIWYYLS